MNATSRGVSQRVHERDIIKAATRHALGVHEDTETPPLTPFGIASCAAAMALVLTDERHPNHAHAWDGANA